MRRHFTLKRFGDVGVFASCIVLLFAAFVAFGEPDPSTTAALPQGILGIPLDLAVKAGVGLFLAFQALYTLRATHETKKVSEAAARQVERPVESDPNLWSVAAETLRQVGQIRAELHEHRREWLVFKVEVRGMVDEADERINELENTIPPNLRKLIE